MVIKFEPLGGEDLASFRAAYEGGYLHGQCYAYAIAVSRGTGLPMAGLALPGDRICHAGVRLPNGQMFDARGPVTEEEFAEPFGGPGRAFRLEAVTEQDLFSHQPELNGEFIERTQRIAQASWPDLPWNEGTYLSRVKAFMEKVEAASRQCGVWIRAPLPTQLPVIDEEFEGIAGYALKQTLGSTAFFFDRLLEED